MVGALGGLTIGTMARVSLGHTGRPLEAHPVIALSSVLVALAAIARLTMTLHPVAGWLLIVTAVLWSTAFAIFAAYYTPILLTSRRN